MSNLIKVPFHGADILCMQDTRGEWVITKPLCERLGVDARAQQRRIERSAWGQGKGSAMMAAPSAGGLQQTFCLHRSRIAMWLATIDTSRIKDEVARAFLELLQVEAADVLDAYFSKRSAPQPTPTGADQTYALLQRINAAGQLVLAPEQMERVAQVVAQTRAESGDWRSVCAEHGYYTGNCEPCNEAKHVPPPKREASRTLALAEVPSGALPDLKTTEMPS